MQPNKKLARVVGMVFLRGMIIGMISRWATG